MTYYFYYFLSNKIDIDIFLIKMTMIQLKSSFIFLLRKIKPSWIEKLL